MTIRKAGFAYHALITGCLFALLFGLLPTITFAQTDKPPTDVPIDATGAISTDVLFGSAADKPSALMMDSALMATITDNVARARITGVRVEQLGRATTATTTGPALGERVTLNLFEGTTLVAVRDETYLNPSGSYTWIGHIADIPLSQATFVVRENTLYGAIQAPGVGEFAVQPLDGVNHLIQQASPQTILPEDDTYIADDAHAAHRDEAFQADQATQTAAMQAALAGSTADNGSLIDVAVVYSDDVNDANAQSFAELFTAYTNQAYKNSNVNQRAWLVDVERFVYNETGSLSADLNNITSNANPDVAAYRNQYHADLVMFFVANDGSGANSCSGLAWLQTNVNLNFAGNGFGVMKACSFGAAVYAHELGHNMGSRHDWYMDAGTTPFTYAHGYVDTTNRFRTIMAYNNRCSALGFSCTTIPYFSNPTVSYNGATTGVAGGTSTACATGNANPPVNCDADERRTLNQTAANTSAFRQSLLTWTGAVDSDWHNAANWTINEGAPNATVAVNRAPRAFDNLLIPSNAPRMPTISSGNATAREVVIAAGATLNMTGGVLTVGWRWEDAGGFTGTGGTLIFNGPVEIALTTAAPSHFANVQLGDGVSSPEVILNSALDINGNLLIKAGAQLKAGSNTIKVAGNWSDEGNGFVRGSSTVELDGANQNLDKVTTTTLLNQDFSAYTTCCTNGVPSGWARSHTGGFGFAFGNGEAWLWSDTTDGWLFTSALNLQPGITYQVSFQYLKGSSSTSSLTIGYGAAQNAAGMVNTLGTITNLTTAYQTATFSFTPATAGAYYIGFHSLQTAGYNKLDNIVVQGLQPINFYNLTVKSSGSATLLKNAAVYNNLLVDPGATLALGTNALTVEGTVTNNGALKQTKTANANGLTEFLRIKNEAATADKYYGVEITPAGNLGSTVVAIRGNQNCTEGGGATTTVKRCFDITPTTAQPAQIRFYYRSAEQNGETSPNVYHYSGAGATWTLQTLGGRGGNQEALWVTATGITAYSPFRLDDQAVGATLAAPTNLQAVAFSASRIDLSWQDNATNENGFRIERCAGANCTTFQEVTTLGSNVILFSNTALTEGIYCYRVRAYNNETVSAYSAAVCRGTYPTAPRWSAVRTLSDQMISLTWLDQSTTETGFVILRCPTANCASPSQLAIVGANITTYQHNGLAANSTHYYRVYATNSSGNSTPTSYVGRTTGPNPPSNLTVAASGPSQITLNWQDNATNENGFRIERCTGVGCTTMSWARTVVTNTTQFINTSLAANTTYCYQVRSFSASGPSRYTALACATTPAALTAADSAAETEVVAPIGIESATLGYVRETVAGEISAAVDWQTPFIVQAQPACADGTQPAVVELALNGQSYPMSAVESAGYRATIDMAPLAAADSTYALDLYWQCANADEPQQESLGAIHIIALADGDAATVPQGARRLYLPLIAR